MLKEELESQLVILNRKSLEAKDEFARLSSIIEKSVAEIDSTTKESIEKLSALLNNEEELKSSISGFEQEISQLKESIEKTRDELDTLGKTKNQLLENSSTLSKNKEEKTKELGELESKLKNLNQELDEVNAKIKETSSKLIDVEKEHGEKVGVHIKKAEEIEQRNKRNEMKSRVLKHLLDTGYLVDPAYDILKRIGQPGIDDANKLSLSANAQESTVRQILAELAAKEIVNFDAGSGKFTVLKKMEDLE